MIKKKSFWRNCFLWLPAFLALSACGSSEDSKLNDYIHEVKTRKAKPIEPIPDFVNIPKFAYPENDVRRSPFKKKEVLKAADELAPNTKRPRQPLEMFPLDALKFVGIIKQGSMVWALITRPDGTIARIRVGEFMGQNFGKVISISNTSLKLEETVQVSGKWEKKVTTLSLGTNE